MATYLGINFVEHFEAGDYPCIKCNIGHNQYGEQTKIYHLPFDQQYDSTKIQDQGEFYAMTVQEAETAGFRRAFEWHGNTRQLLNGFIARVTEFPFESEITVETVALLSRAEIDSKKVRV